MTEPTSSGADAELAPPSASPTAASPASASVWEDFIDIFYAPSQVFARRSTSGFIIPMIVVTLAVGLLFVVNSGVLAPIIDAEWSRSMAQKSANMTPQQIEGMEKMRSAAPTIAKVMVFVTMPIMMFLVGLALWLVGKLFDARQTLGQAVMVAAYSFIPRVIEGIVTSVQGLLLDTTQITSHFRLSLGVGRFLDPETTSPMLLALLARVDVFTIWVTVLLAIGLSVTGKIPRSRAAIAGVILWFLGSVPPLLQAR